MIKSDSQRRIMEIISARRFETIPNLAKELNVSRYTIMRDLNEITSEASFYTRSGKYGGGVYACEHWYFSRTYLTSDEEQALKDVLAGLQPDLGQIQRVLDAFARPKVQDDKV